MIDVQLAGKKQGITWQGIHIHSSGKVNDSPTANDTEKGPTTKPELHLCNKA